MTPPPNPGSESNKPEDDPLGGMDPMAWLESLARRQGADPQEFVTAANLDIPVPGEERPVATPQPPLETPSVTPVASAVPSSASATDDLLGGIDPLAWLESLARRQGANPDEFVTSADMDIPVPTASSTAPAPSFRFEPPVASPDYAPDLPAFPSAEADLTPVGTTAPGTSADDPLGGMDPMAWLESLARRQGADPQEFVTSADLDIPIPTAESAVPELAMPDLSAFESPVEMPDFGADLPAFPDIDFSALETPQADLTPAGAPVPAASADDPLGGMDPMAWLESLARRQGADPQEFVTSADLDIPIPTAEEAAPELAMPDFSAFESPVSTPDFGADLPAFADFEMAAPMSEPEPPAPMPVASAAPAPTGGDELSDLLGGMDPLAWMEKLAAAQGANPEELVTFREQPPAAAPVEPPKAPPVVAAALPPPPPPPVPEALPDFEALGLTTAPAAEMPAEFAFPDVEGDTMAWLASLTGGMPFAGEPVIGTETPAGTDVMDAASALSWLESLSGEPDAAVTPEMPAVHEAPPVEGGLSNDPAQIHAWLEAQARNLEETRHVLEAEPEPVPDAPAVEGEIPTWLLESMPHETPAPSAEAFAPVLSEAVALPDLNEALPDWLNEGLQTEAAPSAEDDLAALIGMGEALEEAPAAEVSVMAETEMAPLLSTAELEAITQPGSPEEVDSWAEALDEEYERKRAGEDSVPDWYQEAVTRLDAAETAAQPAEAIPAEGEVPAWLVTMQETQVTSELEDIPSWLTEMAPEDVTAAAETVTPPPAPARPVVVETVRPEPTIAPPIMQPAASVVPPAPVRQVERRPAPEVLAEARSMKSGGQVLPALERYQHLIDRAEQLEESRADLRELAKSSPNEPKVFRLLGDAHMRLGDMQAALDTYLSALKQL